jgi:branched-subunit amino acid aminotransferase/4-amino-4-deoxychorismate lyase
MDFILHNGKIIRESETHPGSIWWSNDLQFKQEMWFANGEIPHFYELYSDFAQLMNFLNRSVPGNFPPPSELLRLMIRVINKNKAFMGGWATCRFLFREKSPEYMVSITPHPDRLFPLDAAGRMGIISPLAKSTGNPLSRYSFFSETLWKTEKIRTEKKRDEVSIFLNEKGTVTETEGANLFCILNNQLITPSVETGCIVDIMREYVLQTAKSMGLVVIQSVSLTPLALHGMEEIFTVSEGEGFKWLKGIGGKRYLKTTAELIWRQINKGCFSGFREEGVGGS